MVEAPAEALVLPPEAPQTVEVADSTYSSCILFLRHFYSIPIYGDAFHVKPNITIEEARTGDVAVFRYPNELGHVAYVTSFEYGGFWVDEANFKEGKRTQRFISLDDKRLIGFWRKAKSP